MKNKQGAVQTTIWYDKEYLKGLAKKNHMNLTELGPIVGHGISYFSSQPTKGEPELRQICELLDGDWDSLIGKNFSSEYKGIKENDAMEEVRFEEPTSKKATMEDVYKKDLDNLFEGLEEFRKWIVNEYIKDNAITPLDVMISLDKSMKGRL